MTLSSTLSNLLDMENKQCYRRTAHDKGEERDRRRAWRKRSTAFDIIFLKTEHSVWGSSNSRKIKVNMAGATKDMEVLGLQLSVVVVVENKVWKQGSRLASKCPT